MTAGRKGRDRFGVLGIGAVACLACCAGPVVAFLGGLSLAGLVSTLVIGGAGLLVAGAAGVPFLALWRRGSSATWTVGNDEAMPIAPPLSARRS
jgi:hypothetical protein